MSKPSPLDTNVLVRCFTGQPPDMAERARALIAQADTGNLNGLPGDPQRIESGLKNWRREGDSNPR